ncbi:MAG: hypothetical protein EOO77_31830 [Oxalobacteraceae bacterium]|nr:MAG: hypothetical protein EOO77_31830 [Oxalobacteraceae bacterium]
MDVSRNPYDGYLNALAMPVQRRGFVGIEGDYQAAGQQPQQPQQQTQPGLVGQMGPSGMQGVDPAYTTRPIALDIAPRVPGAQSSVPGQHSTTQKLLHALIGSSFGIGG